jgi:small-conductance mechanosensitive channel
VIFNLVDCAKGLLIIVEDALRESSGRRDGGAVSLGYVILTFVGMLTMALAMQTVGIELGAVFAAGAVFAVGFRFAMQNIAQNFVSGIILLIERTIEPGDVLELGGASRSTTAGCRAESVWQQLGLHRIRPAPLSRIGHGDSCPRTPTPVPGSSARR